MRVFYCDHYEMDLPPEHRFPASKYRLLRRELESDARIQLEPALPATQEQISRAHHSGYVRAFLEGALDAAAMRRIGFPWSRSLVARTLASAGATLQAASEASIAGWSGALAGGTHHAFYSEGSGYCVFNDIAVAIAELRALGVARRFAVIDLDVHQGDGTAQLFEADPDVFTLSLHGRNNFPFRKQHSSLDVALPDGTGNEDYLAALETALPRVFEHRPEFLFYQAGADPLAEDALGKLCLTQEGLAARNRCVFDACLAYGAPQVITLGGGYARPIELTVAAHAGTYRMAAEYSAKALHRIR